MMTRLVSKVVSRPVEDAALAMVMAEWKLRRLDRNFRAVDVLAFCLRASGVRSSEIGAVIGRTTSGVNLQLQRMREYVTDAG